MFKMSLGVVLGWIEGRGGGGGEGDEFSSGVKTTSVISSSGACDDQCWKWPADSILWLFSTLSNNTRIKLLIISFEIDIFTIWALFTKFIYFWYALLVTPHVIFLSHLNHMYFWYVKRKISNAIGQERINCRNSTLVVWDNLCNSNNMGLEWAGCNNEHFVCRVVSRWM